MRVALLQMNSVFGDFEKNAKKICSLAKMAKEHGAQAVFTPELAISGFPPQDLLYVKDFFKEQDKAIQLLATCDELKDIQLVVGHSVAEDGKYFNSASVIHGGEVKAVYKERMRPNDTIFDELRHFAPEEQDEEGSLVLTVDGVKIGLLIGKEIWHPEPLRQFRFKSIDFAVVLNSSPFYIGKHEERMKAVRSRVEETGTPVAYLNAVGGHDEWVYDGASFVINQNRKLGLQASFCKEELILLEWDDRTLAGGVQKIPEEEERLMYEAATLGLKDYVQKNGFKSVCLGLSGGLDSAMVMAMAVDALGADKVEVLLMPSKFTQELSNTAAEKMAKKLGVKYSYIEIDPLLESFKQGLAKRFDGLKEDVTEENLQARIRGTLLMALSNKTGAMLLTTGNKSEVAVGYCTLYGDTNGGFAPLKDIYKTKLYKMARWLNESRKDEIIPVEIIERKPSAELRPNQTDQDSLPEYEVLDAILVDLVENRLGKEEIIAKGVDPEVLAKVMRLVRVSEYKRSQGAIGPKLNRRSFGSDRKYPLTNRFNG